MTRVDSLADLDGLAQGELVRRGEVSPTELVEAAIERAERLNPKLNAIIHPTYERARREAREAAIADGPHRPLRGVPFLLKDAGGEQAGEFSMTGLRVLKDVGARASEDSAVALFAREAGLVSIGRTNTPELALLPTTEPEAFGASRNPWNLDYSTGGSSGGSAAAVAAGIVPIAHASDGGGSIRGPASKCGLVGLKPTRGRTSLGPQRGEHWSSLSTHHVVTRTVRDSAAALDALARPFPGDPYTASCAAPVSGGGFLDALGRAPGAFRIGYLAEAPREIEVHPDTRRALDGMARTLEDLGHEIEIIRPELFERIEPTMTYVRIVAANVARALERTGEKIGRTIEEKDVEPLTWALASRGHDVSVTQHLADIEFIHRFGRDVARYQESEGFHLLLSPTQALPPARIGEISSTPEEPLRAFVRAGPYGVYTLPFNLTGQPGISIPAGFTTGESGPPTGLPIGAQLVAPTGREDWLLSLAAEVEAERRWDLDRPAVFG